MNCIKAIAFCLLACAFVLGCGRGTLDKTSPEGFLAWSMDQYHGLHSFSATCAWDLTGLNQKATRQIEYQSPNIFSVVSTNNAGLKQSSVSDGMKLVDLSNVPNVNGQSYAAPASIADAQSMQMQHPFFCGSLLYKFFAGGSKLDGLVDESKGQITDAGEKDLPGGGKGKLINFYGTGLYGHVSVLIDEKSGMVQSISYDSAPLLEQIKEKGGGQSPSMQTTETYTNIQRDPTISADNFKVAVPKGKKIDDLSAVDFTESKSPVQYGKPAPDITVTSLDGKKVKLSDLRGKPVFLDFWATWCGPCRESLPHTQKLAADHGTEITVLAISDEDESTIQAFEKDNNYSYPTFRDADHSASEKYQVEGIPTFVIIDAKGNVVNYQSGYGGSDPIDRALEKVGIKMKES